MSGAAVGPLESQQNKGVANGYAELDGSGYVPTSELGNVGATASLKANNGSDFADEGSVKYNTHVPALTPVAAVSVANIATRTTATTTIDGYALANGDLVLLVGQSTASQNGLWLVPASGNWTRPTEFPTTGVVKGRTVAVLNGTVFANSLWVLDAPTTGVTIDTTSQTWKSLSTPNTGLIGLNSYAPSSGTPYDSTSTTLAAVDTTHMTVSFVAPSSGRVLVRLSGLQGATANGGQPYWGLLDHTTGNLYGNPVLVSTPAVANVYANQMATIVVSGLTAGQAYQMDWALATGIVSDNVRLLVNGLTSKTVSGQGPATMEVWAA